MKRRINLLLSVALDYVIGFVCLLIYIYLRFSDYGERESIKEALKKL